MSWMGRRQSSTKAPEAVPEYLGWECLADTHWSFSKLCTGTKLGCLLGNSHTLEGAVTCSRSVLCHSLSNLETKMGHQVGCQCSLRFMNLVYESLFSRICWLGFGLNLLEADLCTAQTIWLYMHKEGKGLQQKGRLQIINGNTWVNLKFYNDLTFRKGWHCLHIRLI